jgi:nucleotide-binding universal stress UspA family protein
MFKHILAPVDGSRNAMVALEKAAALRALTDADLTILTVFRHHSPLEASLSLAREDDPENVDDIMRAYAREVAESAKARAVALGATGARAFVRSGPVARTIVAFGREHGVDLIVIGSRGLGSIEGFLLGSVSHKVSGIADCPVLLV